MQAASPLPRGFRVGVGTDGSVRVDSSPRVDSFERGGKHYLVHGRIEEGAEALGHEPLEQALVGLRGSFAVIEIDGSKVRVAADRTASRKVFVSTLPTGVTIGSDLHRLPVDRHPLSRAGVGCYLSSLGMIDGLTAFEGVTSVRPSHLVDIESGAASESEYWAYRPIENTELTFDDAVSLTRSLLERVTVRAAGKGPVFVSLSGGQDSRSQLAYVVRARGTENVIGLTYYRGGEYPGTDLEGARATAQELGVEHMVVPGYCGSFLDVIRANATLGQGVAQFCDEVDAWVDAAPILERDPESVLLAGDLFIYFQTGLRSDLHSHMWRHGIRDSRGARWFFEQLPEGSRLAGAWDERWEVLAGGFAAHGSVNTARQYTYLHHRVGQTLNSWRDRFPGAFVHTVAPYTQPELIELTASVPWDWKTGPGSLYRAALRADFPEMTPSTENDWNRPSWPREIRTHRNEIMAMLNEEPSPLDELIPPETIARLVDAVAEGSGRSMQGTHARERLLSVTPVRKAYRRARKRIRRQLVARSWSQRSQERMLRDVLVLRTAVASAVMAARTTR